MTHYVRGAGGIQLKCARDGKIWHMGIFAARRMGRVKSTMESMF